MIIVFGGSFDPPHNAHVDAVRSALRDHPGSPVFVVPALASPLKGCHEATYAERLEMCRIAFDGVAIVSDAEASGRMFTVELLEKFSDMFPLQTISFLMGSDCLDSFPRWRSSPVLGQDERFKFLIYQRPGHVIDANALRMIRSSEIVGGISSPLSSTAIRLALDLGADVSQYVPSGVLSYMRDRGLYGIKASA